MEEKKCFVSDCPYEAEYVCQCIYPMTYSCGIHISEHANLPNKVHAFESIFVESRKETKEEILKVLTERMTKYIKLKKTLLDSFNQHFLNSESNLKELIKALDKSSDELNYFIYKIKESKKILKSFQDPISVLLSLQPEEVAEKIKALIPAHLYLFDNAEVELKVLSKLNNPYIIGLDSYFKVDNKEKIPISLTL